jgi:hypothetical protein
MNMYHSRLGACVVSIALLGSVTQPGCDQIAQIVYTLIIELGKQAIRLGVVKIMEEILDKWAFDENDPRNSRGGEVLVDTADELRGYYNGKMMITIKDEETGGASHQAYDRPPMRRSSPTSKWRLDPDIVERIKKTAAEAHGPSQK